MANKKPNWVAIAVIGGVIGMVIFGILVFLFTKDGIGGYQEVSGWEALKAQGSSFWTWVIICTIAAIILAYVAYANYTGNGSIGRSLPGSDGLTWALIIVACILLFSPWGKACTDKTNSNVTAPHGDL